MTPDNLAEIKAAAEKAVKPLEWDSIDSTSMWASQKWAVLRDHWWCYRITLRADRYKQARLEMSGNWNYDLGIWDDWDEAKAACQGDFQHRILSALDLDALVTEIQQHRADPSSGKGEAVAWRHNLTGIIRTDKPGLGLHEDYTPIYSDPSSGKGEADNLFTYQRTFDAIAAAVKPNEVGIGISVAKFIEAFGPITHPTPKAVLSSNSALYTAVIEAIEAVREYAETYDRTGVGLGAYEACSKAFHELSAAIVATAP